MPSPIIKIKRGTGKPPVWVPVTNSGLTAGEFAFDANTGVLYVGMLGSGGYTGHFDDSIQNTKIGSTVSNVIPIGYQISNDVKFGGNGAVVNNALGYSNYTIPSTYAVKQYVSEAVIAAAVGVEFSGGEGISVVAGGPAGTSYIVSNTGVIRGFTSINAIGNAVGDTVRAKSGRDGLTFIGGSGILFTTSNSGGSVQVTNIGVTGIAGFTGNISSITPIVSLSGFTQSINLANRQVITNTTPIGIDTTSSANSINIFHDNSGSGSGTVDAIVNGVPQLLTIKYNTTGHIEAISQTPLSFTASKPAGFTQAVQDAAYPGITTNTQTILHPKAFDYGVYFAYDDASNLLRTYNTGITSIAAGNGVGLSGPVRLLGGTNITLTQDVITNGITVAYSGSQFNRVAGAVPSTVGYSSTGIYNGGIVSAGTATANSIDSLNVVAGRGIGISAGTSPDGNSRVLFIYNSGVNMVSAYDSGGALLGGTGLSGPINLVAGTNIQLSRGSGATENTITISSSGGGGGGAISGIQADYTTESIEDYVGTYSGSGVTGVIEFIGLNGLVTKQDSGQNGAPSTKDGDLYVGLSSQLVLPSNVFLESPPYSYPLITIPTARATSVPPLPHCGMDDYFITPIGYSKLTTDVVEGGLTAAVTYGSNNPQDPFSPSTSNLGPFTEPGKLLILRAREGVVDRTDGPDPQMTGLHAEVRLVAYPNAENMIAYIQEGFDPNSLPSSCPGGVCVGFPPTFPSCQADPNNPVWYGYTKNDVNHKESTSSVVVHGNLVGKDSLYVNKDIWLTGDLINAKTGCLYQLEGGQGGVNTPGGNLGLTGDLVVNGSIYVHGGTAFFNVRDLSTESALVSIGGVSAGTGYSDPYGSITTSQSGYTGDRGLILHTYSRLPYSPLLNQASSAEGPKRGFVGVDASEGTFKYIVDAGLQTFTTGSNTYTFVSSGRLGPAQFSEINTVGITSDLTTVSLRTGTTSLRTDLSFDGFAKIVAPSNSANIGQITLGNNANVIFNDVAAGVVKFARGITFDVTANTGQFGGEANALRIQYNGSNGSRNLTVRNPGLNSHIQLVDTGRSSSSDSGLGSVELTQQIIYNKTLADGTIIDCGNY